MSDVVNLHGFGSRSKDITVKAYATEELLLADKPKENTIGIITSVPFPSYSLCPYAPGLLTNGLLWIKTGVYSNVAFSAQEKNPVMLYPITAMQYIDNTFTYVPARSYQGGEWVDWWEGNLYDHGNEIEPVTGGWETLSGAGMAVTKEADHLLFDVTGSSGRDGIAYTKNKIRVDHLTALTFQFDVTSGSQVRFGLMEAIPEASSKMAFAKYVQSKTAALGQTLTLDVSGISGEYYIAAQYWITSGRVWSVTLEQEG